MIFQIAMLVLLLISLINYKGAAGIRRIQPARATGALHLTELPIGREAASRTPLSSAVAYLKIGWPALVFGILISAAVRTGLSHTPLHRIFNGGTAHDQFAAELAGAPLMLCSCCAAPIFPTVYQRTRKVAPALALVLAAPSLNPAALALSFILFPWRIAGMRLAMALLLVPFRICSGSAHHSITNRSIALTFR
jgi:Predicted permease